jgi:hypothetical protein
MLFPYDHRVKQINQSLPLLSMIIISVLGFLALIFDKAQGIRKTKTRYLLLGIVLFAVADVILKRYGESAWIVADVLQAVDIFHLLVAGAMYCFGNVVHPRTRGELKLKK